ncbi:MAG: hypothetical protein AAFO02_08480 [Bacteroidota bacterium]
MMRITLMILVVGSFLFGTACQADQSAHTEETVEEVDLKSALQGTWQTFQINVAINTADGRDTFRTESLTEEVWEDVFKMEPPVYYFQPDQKYRLVHRNILGELVNQSRGMWNTFGDTLVLIEPEATYQYEVKLANGRAAFRAFMDWDADGEEDDEYQGLQRQISISAEEEQ